MALLPQMDYEYNERSVTDVFAGYNHRPRIGDGEFYNTQNMTTACFPLLANRRRRGLVRRLTAPGGILAKEKLALIENGALWYGGEETGLRGLAPGEKQMVSMGAYLCIFPDKLYFNTADPSDYGSMEAVYRSSGRVRYSLCRRDGTPYENLTVSREAPPEPANAAHWLEPQAGKLFEWSAAGGQWTQIETLYTKLEFSTNGILPRRFRENDGVTVSGAQSEALNGSRILHAVGGGEGELDYIVVTGLLEKSFTQTQGSVSIRRAAPDMDFVCEAKNRLWGCKYGTVDGKTVNELYCSALGDFRNWEQYMGLSTDSWRASVGSDGPWTGAVNYLGYPMFFKENRIHRVSVSAIGAHQVSETVCRGVQAGCSGSLQVVNETLLYKSRADVCAFQGSFPESVSEALGDETYSQASAGSAGDRYYLSMKNAAGEWSLFVYDVKQGLWMREDEMQVTQFAALGGELYAMTPEALWALNGSEGEPEAFVSWRAESGIQGYQFPDRKYVSRFNLRLWMEEGAEADVYLRYDSDGDWVRQGRIKMKGTRTVTLPVRPRRCDHFQMRICGRGDVKLYSIAKILSIGSDVG